MNLQKSRILFALTTVGFLVLCNLGYLFAVAQNRQPLFASQLDQPSFQILSLLLLLGMIGFGAVSPRRGCDES